MNAYPISAPTGAQSAASFLTLVGTAPRRSQRPPVATLTGRGPRCVAIIDPCGGGHHFSWLLELSLAFLQAGSRVVAICAEPERLQAALIEARPGAATQFSVVSAESIARPSARCPLLRRVTQTAAGWSRLNNLLDALPPSQRPDSVFFAYVDPFLTRGLAPWIVDAVFHYPWSALYMSPAWMRIGRRLWPELATSEAWCLQSQRCESISIIDEGLKDRLARLLPDKPVVRLPDFLPTVSAAVHPGTSPELFERARGRCIVGVVGSLQSRKGISTLLKLALEHPEGPFFFVFAGRLDLTGFPRQERGLWEKAVARPPENCYIRPSAIPDEVEFAALSNSCAIFFAAYHRFGNSSNTLAWASWLRKPVVVSAGYLMEERVRRFRLGSVVPERDPAATWEALQHLRTQLAQPDGTASFGFAQYLREHSTERLESGIRFIQRTLAP